MAEAKTEFEKLHEALENSSSRNAKLLVAFLLLLSYLLITVAATTDLQLLVPDSRIPMPVLGVELPLFGFYIIAPILVIIMHYNLLLNLLHHARRLQAWDESKSDHKHVLLPGFFFNYTLTFRPRTLNYILLRMILTVVFCFFPLLILLFIQIRFADYHSVSMTSWHSILVFFDLSILMPYWYRIECRELLDEKYDSIRQLNKFYDSEDGFFDVFRQTSRHLIRSFISCGWVGRIVRIIFLPLFIVGRVPQGIRLFVLPDKKIHSIYTLFFGIFGAVSILCLALVVLIAADYSQLQHPLLPRLDVSGETLVASPPSDIIIHAYMTQGRRAREAWGDHAKGIILCGRDLRFANLAQTNLMCADLRSACLKGADLSAATLTGADLSRCQLENARLQAADMSEAKLIDADLSGAHMSLAKLNGANLMYAKLTGSDLASAELRGANLSFVDLSCARLTEAEMTGAFLSRAKLHGANLFRAKMNGVHLNSAELSGALLADAKLICAAVGKAKLNGTDLRGARLDGACLEETDLNAAYLDSTGLRGAIADEYTLLGGVCYKVGPDFFREPDWRSLLQDSLSIPESAEWFSVNSRRVYIGTVYVASWRAHKVDPILMNVSPDSAGFVSLRQELACSNSFAAQGMLDLSIDADSLCFFTGAQLVSHMCDNCPDSLQVIRDRGGIRLRVAIDKFMITREAEKDQ